ncbi:MAG: O-antigen ligase family protein [Candidatus Aminicenantaceae bacterium]
MDENEKKKPLILLAFALILYALFSLLSITLSQIFLGFALVFWVYLLVKKTIRLAFPGFFWGLIAYAALSLLSSAMSHNPSVSFAHSRKLLLFLVVPMAFAGLRHRIHISRVKTALLVSGSISVVFSLLYFALQAQPGERIRGFMDHYMTQAGLLLLFCAVALSLFFFEKRKIRYVWGAVFVLASLALILTLTRNAWVGLVVVFFVLLLLYKPKALILLPAGIGLFYIASPAHIKNRALSIFNPQSYSNAQRIEYIKAGFEIIKDYPFFGTGPHTVHVVFQKPEYRLSEDARQNVHLHNNLIQIAAERGLPALAAWIVFLVWAFISLIKLLKNKNPELFALTSAALASLLAMIVAGLFEYNFGDSEVVTLFLFILTLPFCRERVFRKSQQ